MNLTDKANSIHEGNKDRGFWDEENPNIGEKLCLIHGEVSEALEALRDGKMGVRLPDSVSLDDPMFIQLFKESVKDSFADEMADTIIRCLDLCGYMGIDINWHIEAKLKYNSTRPHKHGRKF